MLTETKEQTNFLPKQKERKTEQVLFLLLFDNIRAYYTYSPSSYSPAALDNFIRTIPDIKAEMRLSNKMLQNDRRQRYLLQEAFEGPEVLKLKISVLILFLKCLAWRWGNL